MSEQPIGLLLVETELSRKMLFAPREPRTITHTHTLIGDDRSSMHPDACILCQGFFFYVK